MKKAMNRYEMKSMEVFEVSILKALTLGITNYHRHRGGSETKSTPLPIESSRTRKCMTRNDKKNSRLSDSYKCSYTVGMSDDHSKWDKFYINTANDVQYIKHCMYST